jgi:hypothetical protein
MGSCASVRSQNSSNSKQGYKEDLSVFRPKYIANAEDTPSKSVSPSGKVISQKDVTKQLNSRIDSLAVKNKRMRFAQGFRVLVYTGNSSEEVKKIKLKLRGLLSPDEEIYDEYKQPTFRLKAGDCYTRLEAFYILNKLQKDFPNAIIVPDQINMAKEK